MSEIDTNQTESEIDTVKWRATYMVAKHTIEKLKEPMNELIELKECML
jgi:hypothetical protein